MGYDAKMSSETSSYNIDDQITNILAGPSPKGKFLVFREHLGLTDVTLPRGRDHG